LMFLAGTATQDPAVMTRLQQKVAGVGRASVGHPHLMRCYHLIDTGSFKFIVLEDIEGKRVERQLSTGGPMGISEACRIVRQAALGLSRMHSMGQIHDAIRPAHLWIEPNHNVKLLNFPLIGDPTATPVPLAKQIDQAGKVPPEADYIAPELITGKQAPDARSDIYSLGCTLYHMLAGVAPFAGGDLRQKLTRHVKEQPRPLHEVNPQIPPPLAKAVQYMINKDPELRYQQANSIVEAILPFISAQDAQTMPVPPSPQEQAYERWLAQQAAAVAATPQAEEVAEAEPVAPAAEPVKPMVAQAAPVQAVAAQPVAAQPAIMTAMPVGGASPYAPQAMMAQPVTAAPVHGQPMMAQPMMAQPVMAQPMPGHGFPQAASPFPQPNIGGMPNPAASGDGGVPLNPAMNRVRRRKSSKMPLVFGVLLLAGGGAALHFSGALQKILDKVKSPGNTAVASSTQTPAGTKTTTIPATGTPAKTGGTTPAVTPANPNDTAMAANTAGTTPPSGTPADARETIYALNEDVWATPTTGAPLDAKYLAPGAQAIIALRPAELVKHAEGEKLFDHAVTGHLGDWVREELPKIAGLPLEKIEQVVISVLDGGAGPPSATYRIRTTEAVAHEALLANEAWKSPAADESAAGKLVFKNDTTSYYFPAAGDNRLIVLGPHDALKVVIESDGAATALPLELEVMLKQTDASRSLSILFVPRVMLADGKQVLTGPAKLWRAPVEDFLLAGDGSGDLPKAVLASLHLGDQLFVELREFEATAGPQNTSPAATVESRLKALDQRVSDYFLDVPPSKYSKPVVRRFNEMMRHFGSLVRVGVGEKQVVARVYLPSNAAHHLAMCSFLATIDNPLSGYARFVPMDMGAAKPAAVAGSPAEQALAKVTSLTFLRQPLDKTIEILADDIGMPIMIDGPNLQLDGITKNQSIVDLAEENKPAKEILKVVLAKANMAGKLCYCIVMKDGMETIHVTTKDGAGKNNWKLPPDYATADPKKK
ncbi:MAG: protein kinase, partial [Planctomycetaceae bacterium]|nr:protein kinase [Planctomycetaceae bacterium]